MNQLGKIGLGPVALDANGNSTCVSGGGPGNNNLAGTCTMSGESCTATFCNPYGDVACTATPVVENTYLPASGFTWYVTATSTGLTINWYGSAANITTFNYICITNIVDVSQP